MSSTVIARPRLTTTPVPSAPNAWFAYNHDQVLGRIYKDHSNNYYYMINRSQMSERYGTLGQAVSSLYEAVEAAKADHQRQITSEFESITSTWGHVQTPGSGVTRRVPNTANTSIQTQTVIISGTECVKTKHGLIAID